MTGACCTRDHRRVRAVEHFLGAGLYGGLLALPLYLRFEVGQDSTRTGMMLLAMGLGSATAPALVPRRDDDRPRRPGHPRRPRATRRRLRTVPLSWHASRPGAGDPPGCARCGLAWAQMLATSAVYALVASEQIGDAVIASSAATDEASQMCAAVWSTTTRPGSVA
jgi:hypothetical protein